MKLRPPNTLKDPHNRAWLLTGLAIFTTVLLLPFIVAGLVQLLAWLIHKLH